MFVVPPALAQGVPTDLLVVPNSDASRPGPQRIDDPFTSGSRYLLQVYDASEFAPLSQGGYITGVSFRAEEGRGGFDATYSSAKVQLATFPQPINTLPASYSAENYKDSTTVYSHSNVRFLGEGSTSVAVPAPFEIRLAFDSPFPYNSSAGNLLVFLELGSRVSGGVSLDADDFQPNYKRPLGYSVSGPGPPPPFGGTPGPEVLVGQFTYTTIPEPRSFTIEIFGALLFLGKYEYRKRLAWG